MTRKGIESMIVWDLSAKREIGDRITERLRKSVHSVRNKERLNE